MVNPHHVAHWYPTAAYLYILGLDMLALAWEYLRRHPDYRLDWLRHHRRRQPAHSAAHAAAQRWGLRLWEDPALDARDAHPAWLPGHDAVVQLYPDADPPPGAAVFDVWHIPGHKQLLHDGKGLALIARSPGLCQRYALAPGLEDGMAVAHAYRGRGATHVPDTPAPMARPRRLAGRIQNIQHQRIARRRHVVGDAARRGDDGRGVRCDRRRGGRLWHNRRIPGRGGRARRPADGCVRS